MTEIVSSGNKLHDWELIGITKFLIIGKTELILSLLLSKQEVILIKAQSI